MICKSKSVANGTGANGNFFSHTGKQYFPSRNNLKTLSNYHNKYIYQFKS